MRTAKTIYSYLTDAYSKRLKNIMLECRFHFKTAIIMINLSSCSMFRSVKLYSRYWQNKNQGKIPDVSIVLKTAIYKTKNEVQFVI